MLQWYRVMRTLALAVAVVAGMSCDRRSLQDDAGGGGSIMFDAAGDGGAGAADRTLPTPGANCGMATVAGGYVAPEILVVYDRSISGDPVQWRAFLNAVIGTLSANDIRLDLGLYSFPKDGPACDMATVTDEIDVPILRNNATHVIPHIALAGTAGNGTPTAAAIGVGAAYLRTLVDASPKLMMLLTDGAPTCAGRLGSPLSADPNYNLIDAIYAIRDANTEGFPTLVVAPSTTTDINQVYALNTMASVGGYEHSQSKRMYTTELDLPDLFMAPDASCIVPLTEAAPVPDVITVMYNGANVPRDGSRVNGWEYIDGEAKHIELYGSWCEQLIASRSFEIVVYFGCP
jgi:hypothetical protein